MSAQAAKRYAKALFEIANEKKLVEHIHATLHEFASILEQQKLVRSLFYSIDVKVREKQQMIDDLLKEKTTPYFINLIKVLFQERRENLFELIIKEYDALYDAKLNRVRAKIVSAVPLDEATKEKTTEKLSKSLKTDVVLETVVDPNILGGFQLQVGDELLDASLRRKFEDMKASLYKGVVT